MKLRFWGFSLQSFLIGAVALGVIAGQHGMIVKERMAIERERKSLEKSRAELKQRIQLELAPLEAYNLQRRAESQLQDKQLRDEQAVDPMQNESP